MWKEIMGHVQTDGRRQIIVNYDRTFKPGDEVFIRKERRGWRLRLDKERSSYLEITDNDLVIPHIRREHHSGIFIGFAPSFRYPEILAIQVDDTPLKIIKHDIWVVDKNWEIRGVAWHNAQEKREQSFYYNAAIQSATDQLTEQEKKMISDTKRFRRKQEDDSQK
jgi:hypothetical protein